MQSQPLHLTPHGDLVCLCATLIGTNSPTGTQSLKYFARNSIVVSKVHRQTVAAQIVSGFNTIGVWTPSAVISLLILLDSLK